jgi:hypothetical protein
MSADPIPVVPPFPSKESLLAFFRTREPVRLASAAYLLAIPEHEICARVADETSFIGQDSIPWVDVVRWLFELWPLSRLAAALPEGTLPEELRTVSVRVAWSIPAYLVTAIEVQAYRKMRAGAVLRGLAPEDYVAEMLQSAIEAETLDALDGDAAFLDAFFFPEGEKEREARKRRMQRRKVKDEKRPKIVEPFLPESALPPDDAATEEGPHFALPLDVSSTPVGGRTRLHPTRLELFLRVHGIKPAQLAKESGFTRQYIAKLRVGTAEPTPRCITAIVAALRRLSREQVRAEHVFEVEATP